MFKNFPHIDNYNFIQIEGCINEFIERLAENASAAVLSASILKRFAFHSCLECGFLPPVTMLNE